MDAVYSVSSPGISADEIKRHGIVDITSERFEVGGDRYDRLSDAVAEARRRNELGKGR
jgi:hypothetical protein